MNNREWFTTAKQYALRYQRSSKSPVDIHRLLHTAYALEQGCFQDAAWFQAQPDNIFENCPALDSRQLALKAEFDRLFELEDLANRFHIDDKNIPADRFCTILGFTQNTEPQQSGLEG
jgi:hypothetical protein